MRYIIPLAVLALLGSFYLMVKTSLDQAPRYKSAPLEAEADCTQIKQALKDRTEQLQQAIAGWTRLQDIYLRQQTNSIDEQHFAYYAGYLDGVNQTVDYFVQLNQQPYPLRGVTNLDQPRVQHEKAEASWLVFSNRNVR
jgi:hypothetical protein